MSPVLLFCILIAYFALLLGVAWATSRNANNDSFYIGNKSSNWMLVAFGMVGTTLSGATFISVPGAVGIDAFGYGQILIGYVFGYIAVAYILLPLYYRLKLTSIYHYLDVRLGPPRLPERGRRSSSCRACSAPPRACTWWSTSCRRSSSTAWACRSG